MPPSVPVTNQLPISIQLPRREHLPANLEQPPTHFQRSLPHLPSQQLRRKNRIQQANIHPLIQKPHGQPIRISQLLANKSRKPNPERPLITNKPTVDVALKPQRMSKRPRRQRRVDQLLKSQLICRTQSAPPEVRAARWSGAGKGAAAWRASRSGHGPLPSGAQARAPNLTQRSALVRMLSMAEGHRHDPLLPVVGDADALQVVLDRVVILADHDVGPVFG